MAAPVPIRAVSSPEPMAPLADSASRDNMRQLVNLRWLAVIGQFVTILIVHFAMGVRLPLLEMLAIVGALAMLNIISLAGIGRGFETGNAELLVALLLDVAALTGLLYLSGGATNPFISLYLLQVVLGAILLRTWSSWVIVAVTSLCFTFLVAFHKQLVLPPQFKLGLFDLYILGTLTSFALIAVLFVLFVTRINSNLRARDARLAAMRQQAAEEDHIVRMGLLASGAAHELGTPLSSLAVIINDWSHTLDVSSQPELAEEIEDMRVAVERCKQIVGGILLSAGEARGERPAVTSVTAFLDDVAADWRSHAGDEALVFENRFADDVAIVSDSALKQVIGNILDNGREASGAPVQLTAMRDGDDLVITIRDSGTGFPPEVLANFGKPFHSTKGKLGGGLGLFLVINVIRKMGGRVSAENGPAGGAVVTLTLPLSAIGWTGMAV